MIIKRHAQQVRVGDRDVPYPIASAALQTQGRRTSLRQFVVDSGSSATLLSWNLAIELGVDQEAQRAPAETFRGLGSDGSLGRLMRVDLVFGEDVLKDVEVYFIEKTSTIAGRDGLLGQRGFFERLRFFQYSECDEPYFVLDGE